MEAPLAPDELEVEADEVAHDEAAHRMTARGNVRARFRDVTVQADSLSFDTLSRQGEIAGHVRVHGDLYDLSAERGTFDLRANHAELEGFRGRWLGRAQVAGKRLVIGPQLLTLEEGTITPCLHPEPDLRLAARTLRYYPNAERLNLGAEGVALKVWDYSLFEFPFYTATVGEEKETWDGGLFPLFGFDAYYGFLTSTRLDFSFGENSRGSLPLRFSTGRGWSAGLEHVLAVGPGELENVAMYETPWAVSRGGLRLNNAYRMAFRDGSRLELAADYRSEVNGQPVSRLPEVSYFPPSLAIPGVLYIHNELRAGYLWEESSEARAPRLRWSAPITTPIWSLLPQWQTWLSGGAFYHHYLDDAFGGGSLAWNHRQVPIEGLAFSQTLELARMAGRTPFIHDRQYDAERVRAGVDKDWGPRFTTSAQASWSRVNQQGTFGIEDLTLTGTYRWNCFGFALSFRPLIYGVDFRVLMLNL